MTPNATASDAVLDPGYELTAFRDAVRAWVSAEVAPFVTAWDEAEQQRRA